MSEQIHVCIDRTLPADSIVDASQRAITEAQENAPDVTARAPLPGVYPHAPLELAILTGKKWQTGRTLTVGFLDGSAGLRAKVEAVARQWEDHANLTLDFGNHASPEIRIGFTPGGSWSYLGTDALSIQQGQPTMNYGWLTDASPDDEISRVVLHEFGHALSAIHEHQNPAANIPWDKPAVYAYYGGPPNNWTKAQIDSNLFAKYSTTVTNHTDFDRDSIMLYAIPNSLTLGDYEVGWNRVLSSTDKAFMATLYPKASPAVTELTISPAYVKAAIGAHAEQDLYAFTVTDAQKYSVETFGPTDVVLSFFGPDSQTTLLAEDDDGGAAKNAKVTAQLSPGRYYARVRHYSPTGTGGYEIAVRQAG